MSERRHRLGGANAKPRLDMPDERQTEYYSQRYPLHWQAAVAKNPGSAPGRPTAEAEGPGAHQLDQQKISSLEGSTLTIRARARPSFPCAFPDDARWSRSREAPAGLTIPIVI